MDIKQLKAFVAIADTETFTAGARRMNITQAAISMQIRHLEQELGIPLFTRTPRKVILTERVRLFLYGPDGYCGNMMPRLLRRLRLRVRNMEDSESVQRQRRSHQTNCQRY